MGGSARGECGGGGTRRIVALPGTRLDTSPLGGIGTSIVLGGRGEGTSRRGERRAAAASARAAGRRAIRWGSTLDASSSAGGGGCGARAAREAAKLRRLTGSSMSSISRCRRYASIISFVLASKRERWPPPPPPPTKLEGASRSALTFMKCTNSLFVRLASIGRSTAANIRVSFALLISTPIALHIARTSSSSTVPEPSMSRALNHAVISCEAVAPQG